MKMETTRAPFMGNMNFPAIPQVVNLGGDGIDGWCQVPPSTMPWGIPMANQPTVVRFTAGPSTSLVKSCDLIKCADFFHTKRKLEDDMERFLSSLS
ncbi:hypothetical protein J437_LFUL016260 [Ladona fulva]|uniref:Uncharacterized protein n=1 Tax=Ladona fulva TaxID=123851 RepID=A0A8K0P6E6_LADFU|nr:hypothetical protein J437_LFUL016260 [Ladona fulva]